MTMAATQAAVKACAVNNVVRVASDTTYPPFENIDTKTNQAVGFDVDLLGAIGKSQGLTVTFVTENFDTIFTKLAQGDYDLVISAVTITDDRSKIVAFSNPYFQSSQSITVRSADASKFKTLDDLVGLKIGVQKGTTGADLAGKIKNATVSGYDLAPQALQALANKDVDAVVIDTPVALNLISASPTLNLVVTKGDLTDEKYGIAVRKECGDLLNKVNSGLRASIADGTYNTIFRQYFGQDAPAAYMPGAAATMAATTAAPVATAAATTATPAVAVATAAPTKSS
jgi:polar amino acid transport system substrate-binding protein